MPNQSLKPTRLVAQRWVSENCIEAVTRDPASSRPNTRYLYHCDASANVFGCKEDAKSANKTDLRASYVKHPGTRGNGSGLSTAHRGYQRYINRWHLGNMYHAWNQIFTVAEPKRLPPLPFASSKADTRQFADPRAKAYYATSKRARKKQWFCSSKWAGAERDTIYAALAGLSRRHVLPRDNWPQVYEYHPCVHECKDHRLQSSCLRAAWQVSSP